METNSEIKFYLDFFRRYPTFEARDLYKVIYQSYFGSAHILGDFESAKEHFEIEYERTPEQEGSVFEAINPAGDVYWLKFGSAKKKILGKKDIWEVFALSANLLVSDLSEFKRVWNSVSRELKNSGNPNIADLMRFDEAVETGYPPLIHHSKSFTENENPHYRIVSRKAIESVQSRILQVFREEIS
jgi:hypothetical protein